MLTLTCALALAHGVPEGDPGDYDEFPAARATPLARITVDDLEGVAARGNDVWGYVSPAGREYALMGTNRLTVVVDLDADPEPVVVAEVPHPPSTWSDMKVYDTFAYVSNENGGGVQVLDLSALDEGGEVVELPPLTAAGLSSSHNVAVDPEDGFLYAVGHNVGGRGLMAFDLMDPAAPALVGAWDGSYVHDAHMVTLHDGPWAGHPIGFLASGRSGFQILDMSDKSSPWLLAEVRYEGLGYAHQGWYDPATHLFYLGDETDELVGNVATTTTYVFDVADLAAPVLAGTYTNGLTSIDHNLQVVDGVVYSANYTSGLRIFDARWDPLAPIEVGFVDTWPASDRTSFDGAWGVFADFPSGRVLVNDGDFGLFVVDATQAITDPPDPVYPHHPAPDGVISPTAGRLSWHRAIGSGEYVVEVGRDPAMADRVWETTTTSEVVKVRPAVLAPCTGYWWTVTARGVNGDAHGPVRPFATGPLGELTGDGVVDDADLANLRFAWTHQLEVGDLDRDGDVDEADKAILLDAWGECS